MIGKELSINKYYKELNWRYVETKGIVLETYKARPVAKQVLEEEASNMQLELVLKLFIWAPINYLC